MHSNRRPRIAAAFHGPQYCLGVADLVTYTGQPQPQPKTRFRTFGHRAQLEIVRHLAVSADGQHIVAAGIGLEVRSWRCALVGDTEAWEAGARFVLTEDERSPVCWLSILGLHVSPGGTVVVVRSDGLVEWWPLHAGDEEMRTRTRISGSPLTCAVITPAWIVGGHWDGSVRLCAAGIDVCGAGEVTLGQAVVAPLPAAQPPPSRECAPAPRLSDAYHCVRALALSEDGSLLFAGGMDNVVRVWSTSKIAGAGRIHHVGDLPGTDASQSILSLAQCGPYLAAGCTVGVLVWRREGGPCAWSLVRRSDRDGDDVYTCLLTSVRLYECAQTREYHLVTAGPHQRCRTSVWSAETGRLLGEDAGPGFCATALALLPPAVTHAEALQAIEDISLATGLLPDVSEIVYKFLNRDHADAHLALDYYAQT